MIIHRRVVAATINARGSDARAANPLSGSSLLPMLVVGLVLTLVGMVAAVALS